MIHIVETPTPPTTADMDRHVRNLTDDPAYRIVRKSGWLAGHTRKWLLNLRPDGSHTATMVSAEHRDGEMSYKLIEETDGFIDTDIPRSMFKQLLKTPAPNEHSAAWRDRVQEDHARPSPTGRIPKNAFAHIKLP